MRPHFF